MKIENWLHENLIVIYLTKFEFLIIFLFTKIIGWNLHRI